MASIGLPEKTTTKKKKKKKRFFIYIVLVDANAYVAFGHQVYF